MWHWKNDKTKQKNKTLSIWQRLHWKVVFCVSPVSLKYDMDTVTNHLFWRKHIVEFAAELVLFINEKWKLKDPKQHKLSAVIIPLWHQWEKRNPHLLVHTNSFYSYRSSEGALPLWRPLSDTSPSFCDISPQLLKLPALDSGTTSRCVSIKFLDFQLSFKYSRQRRSPK